MEQEFITVKKMKALLTMIGKGYDNHIISITDPNMKIICRKLLLNYRITELQSHDDSPPATVINFEVEKTEEEIKRKGAPNNFV